MRILYRGRGVELTEDLRAHVERQLSFVLSRFGELIGHVTVQVANTDGRQGRTDQRCRMVVELRPEGRVDVEDTDGELFAAVSHAADRASRSVGRLLERKRSESRPPPARRTRSRPRR
jgi:ribosomal subunit interface protein